MNRCKLLLIEVLALSSLLFCAGAHADYGIYHYSTLDGPATDTDGDYYLNWYVIPTDPYAEYDTVEVAYLETRMNGAGTWQQVQEWNNVPIYAAYDDVHRTGQAVGTHNYHMLFLIYSPYTGYHFLEDYWDVAVTTPPPPPVPGVTTPPSEVTSGLAAGTPPHEMDVASNGDAVVSVPLQLVSGVAGFQPNLSIAYSSGRGIGRLERKLPEDTIGYGWRAAGISQIRRCVVGQDGANNIQLNGEDSLCLDGMPLVKVSGSHLTQGAIYRTRIESYTKVVIKDAGGGRIWFEVITPDGTVLEYGNGSGSRVNYNGGVDYQWSVNKATNTDSKVITYTYHHNAAKGINYPLEIAYSGAKVVFEYLLRSDAGAVSIGSAEQTQAVFLHTVRTQLDGVKVREYRLLHENSGGTTRLKKIQDCGYNAAGTAVQCMNPLVVDWSTPSPTMGGVPILVSKITDGLGADQQFLYETVIEGGTNAFLFSERPFGEGTPPSGTALLSGASSAALRHVVTQLRRSDGTASGYHDTTYSYQGKGLTSTEHWGFLGFYAQRIRDLQSGIVTYAQHRLDFPFAGQVARVHQYNNLYGSHSLTLTRVESAYAQQGTTSGALLPYATQNIQFIYEGSTQLGVRHSATALTLSGGFVSQVDTTTTTASGASAGTPGSIWGAVPTYTPSGISNTVQNSATFENRTSGAWLIGFTKTMSTTSWAGPSGIGTPIVQNATFAANATSLKVDSLVRFPNHPTLALTTSYTYNGDGNKTGTTVEGVNIVTRTHSASNFHDGRHPLCLTNPLNQQTIANSCDHRFNAYSSVTNPGGQTSTSTRDPFGRTTSVTSHGVTTYSSYIADATVTVNGITSVYRLESNSDISPVQRSYHDKLGRTIRTETQGFGGSYSKTDIWYDALGRVHKESQPYFSGTVHYVTYGYDIRNRVANVTRADGGSTAVAYAVESDKVVVTVTETVKNSAGATVATQIKRSQYNLLGQLVSTTDAHGTTEAATVSYAYDANGNLLSATVDGGSAGTTQATMEYDAAGNRTKLIDPNAGTIITEYNALGEVIKIKDNLNQETQFTYDKLGRITQRNNADGTSTWSWDPTNGIGKLASRTTGNGFTETYSYNTAGRLTSTVTSIVPIGGSTAANFTTAYTYDGYGRLATVTYPGSYTVTRVYNSYGYLSQLKNGSTVLQTLNSANAFGKATKETYGNGVVTDRAYDAKTGRLTAIDTTKSSYVVQNLDYAWRSNGILESRMSTMSSQTRQETFGYDALNRLTQAETFINSANTRDLNYAYNALGNLTSSTSTLSSDTDVTSYSYGAGLAGPHAVTDVVIEGVAHQLTYNNNGAITKYDRTGTTLDKHIAYNLANQPTTIVVGSSLSDPSPTAKEEFRYDTDGRRVHRRSTWKEGGITRQESTYYVGAYESTSLSNDPSGLLATIKLRIGQNIMRVQAIWMHNGQPQFVTNLEYAHRDHLGSIDTVTDQHGYPLRTLAFEPFGTRKAANWQQNIGAAELNDLLNPMLYPDYDWGMHFYSSRIALGFTGHEHLDRTGFIHMNGRVYDPQLGRFLSPDPIVQAPANSQSWNRYSYVFNSPLSFTDPTGFQTQDDDTIDVGATRLYEAYYLRDCRGFSNYVEAWQLDGSWVYESYRDRRGQCHNLNEEPWVPDLSNPPGGGGGPFAPPDGSGPGVFDIPVRPGDRTQSQPCGASPSDETAYEEPSLLGFIRQEGLNVLLRTGSVVGGAAQVVAGAALCGTGLGCVGGAPLGTLGLSNIQEGFTGEPGFVRSAATSIAGDTVGNVAVDVANISGSAASLLRNVLRPGSWKLFRNVSSDYVPAYTTMTNTGLGVEIGTAALSLTDSACRRPKN